jgi:hypothetical protein
MSRRNRGILIFLAVVLLLAGGEVALRLAWVPDATVQVENLGAEPIEDLVVTLGERRFAVPPVRPGQVVRVAVSGSAEGTLRLRFRQRGNALGVFELPGFDPVQMSRDESKLVLKIRPNEVERFQEEAEPTTLFGRFSRMVSRQFDYQIHVFHLGP